jgi:hypothetical protein
MDNQNDAGMVITENDKLYSRCSGTCLMEVQKPEPRGTE